MLKNYITVALRSLYKHKGFSLINVAGLAVGMACCLLLVQYMAYEYSFDQFNQKRDHLYRSALKITQDAADPRIQGSSGYHLGPVMAEAIPEIVRYARVHPNYGDAVLSYQGASGKQTFKEKRVLYADSSFLHLFDYPLVAGSRTQALSSPRTLLLTKSMAEKYFGEEDPVGKQLHVTGWVRGEYTVTGVFEDVPPTSHLQFDLLLPMKDLLSLTRYTDSERGWDRSNFATYFELHPEADIAAAERMMTQVYKQHRGDHLNANRQVEAHLQPLLDIHLNADITGPASTPGDRRAVMFFLILGIVTLVIALVNYINLATARALERAREVGIRKVVGAHRKQLIGQFLMESALLVAVAFAVALVLTITLLPVVNQLAQVHLSSAFWQNGYVWIILAASFVLGTLVAGLYPAFILSAFQPTKILKGKTGLSRSRAPLRKGLVMLQFSASVVLLAGTAIVYLQVTHMEKLDVGFDLEQVLTVERPRIRHAAVADWTTEMNTLKEELRKLPGVQKVGSSSTTPGRGFNWYASVYQATADPSEGKPARSTNIDHDFAEVYGLELVAGEPFREGMALSDSEEARALVNEALVQAVGFPSNEAAIGQAIKDSRGNTFIVHGVLEDFNWSSAHQQAEAVLFLYETRYGDLSMTTRTVDLSETLASIEATFKRLFPDNPFVYVFADEAFNAQYQQDQRFATLFSVFTGLAILIACLGLFGLTAYTAQRRTKEIGVRKVLGATTPSILFLLIKELLLLVSVAFVVATPIAYLIMDRWLDDFAYRIDLGWTVFAGVGLVIGIIAILTVSYQSIKVAMADPTKSLRYE